ncbi:hypothetical protein [Caudoviricetes sp.]|nr:hypothetical protein [Caudoviricetes sp.]
MTQIKAVTIYNKINRLRRAIRAEGSPKVQEAWDDIEPYVSVFINSDSVDKPTGKM